MIGYFPVAVQVDLNHCVFVLNATASCFSGGKGLWEEGKKVWIESDKDSTMGVFAKFMKKYLPNVAWWAGDLSSAHKGSSCPFPFVSCDASHNLYWSCSPNLPSREFSAPTLPLWFCAPLPIQSNSQKGPVSCTHRLLQRDVYSDSGCELYVGSPCSQTNLIQKMGRGVFFPTEFSESVKVKKKRKCNMDFYIFCSLFCIFFFSSSLPQGKI